MAHLGLVSIVVSDYDPAIRFFVDALGFELVEDSPSVTNDGRPKRWVVVRPPGGTTGLLLARADGDEQLAVVGRQAAGRVGFFLHVDDFDAAYARMASAGVQFLRAPRSEPFGQVAVFADIAGNKWDLIGPGAGQHEAMTDSRQPDSLVTSEVVVRDYGEGDYSACRSLWQELTEYHRSIYGDPSIGGDDPGAGFDDYLATPQRVGCWVAESHAGVVGLTGLLDRGTSGEVEPVVVAEAARDRGVGRLLISRVVEQARARGYEYLAIRPVARNVAALRRFYAAGFRTLGGHIDLTMDLAARRHEWLSGASLHGLDFDY